MARVLKVNEAKIVFITYKNLGRDSNKSECIEKGAFTKITTVLIL